MELPQWSRQVQVQSSKVLISCAPSESKVCCRSTQGKSSICPQK
jgi:hypothetical protein